MPLYIRDDTVDALAMKVMKATGAETKTEAVRNALIAQLEAEKNKKPMIDRLREIQAKADKIGPVDPDFDLKKYTDEMWDGL